MTLTELRYIAAVARELHFGHAAESCHVSQPTLSVAIKKLEEELGVKLFERRQHDVSITPIGERVIAQARVVLEEAETIKHIAREGLDDLKGQLRLGVIYTIGPYLLPKLIPLLHKRAPELTLLIEEHFTEQLSEKLRSGELDLIIVSLPFSVTSLETQPLYREPFVVTLPSKHPLTRHKAIQANQLNNETLLLLRAGNCFREQVMDVCPNCVRHSTSAGGEIQRTLESSSIETIRHMVGSGAGVTVLPCTSASNGNNLEGLLEFRPFAEPQPYRDVTLAYRKTFPRMRLIELIAAAVADCKLPGVTSLRKSK
ncbi:MAG: LysR substrate-binding domain-containing protein [Gammaproteobacteria bacterium]